MGNLDKLIKDNYFDTNFAIKRFKIDPKRKSWFINNLKYYLSDNCNNMYNQDEIWKNEEITEYFRQSYILYNAYLYKKYWIVNI